MDAEGRTNQETESRKSCLRDIKKSCSCEGIRKLLFGDTISECPFFLGTSFFGQAKKKCLAAQGETQTKQ